MKLPHLDIEQKHWNNDCLVLGIDEVGRGAFAGPLVVGGVIFNKCCDNKEIQKLTSLGINDSKKLTAKRREKLYKIINEISVFTKTIFTPVSVINKVGIGKATFLGMRDLVASCLKTNPSLNVFVLTDAFTIPDLPVLGLQKQQAIIRGDQISISVAAASIIAKVERDTYMYDLASKYPQYGFEKHVGYGTKFHRESLLQYGPSDVHRTAFISKTLGQ